MTLININHSAEVRRIAQYCEGAATQQARDSMACPRGILEHIVDFFTFGAVRREKVRAYDEFADAMPVALHQVSLDTHNAAIPERLVVVFSGYTVTFTQPGEHHNAAGQVAIEVSQSGKTAAARVNKDEFCRISTALLLRRLGGLPSTAVVLTDDNRMDLQLANLNGAKLIGAKLIGANLNGAKLTGADLTGADLSEADLLRAKLIGAKLIGANLNGANLNGADLLRANLSGASLSKAKLNRANLREAKLNRASLSEADLSEADLSGADLSGANLNRTNLREAKLNGANLRGVNLFMANLSEASLSGTSLLGANLNGANLNGASLFIANLAGANLNGADLSNISQEWALLWLPNWDSAWLDAYLNHINNPESGSLLTMMDSIDEQYADVKLRMARELMTLLQNTTADTSSVALPLMDILSKPPYTDEADIAAWLDTVCTTYIDRNNGQVLPWNAGIFNQSVGLFTRRPALMLSHNAAFIQIVAQGMAENSTPAMKEKAAALYETYLQHERIKPYGETAFFGDYGQKPDWENPEAVNFIILPAVQSGASSEPRTVSAMLLSQTSLEGMLSPRPDSAWNNVYLYRGPDHCLTDGERPAPDDLFARAFPLFNGPYQHMQNTAKFLLLLKTLNLGNLETAFVSATWARNSSSKLVSAADQKTLKDIFAPKLTYSPESGRYGLNDAHYEELLSAYGLTSASDADKGKTLLCLAALFIKYSSSAVFGTETESPSALRQYAYALMAKAHSLDGNLVDKGTLANWTNSLLGLKGVFTCSAVLSNLMVELIRSRFPEVLSGIMPPAWG